MKINTTTATDFPISLSLRYNNGQVAAEIKPRKRPASPSITATLEPTTKRACTDKLAKLSSLKEIVSYNLTNTKNIEIPRLFKKIYDNEIEDIKDLKDDQDFQSLCTEMCFEGNGSKITHFIAHSIYWYSERTTLLEYFDFLPPILWVKKNKFCQTPSDFSNHPEILKKEIRSFLHFLTPENENVSLQTIGQHLIVLVANNCISKEEFDEIWNLIKAKVSVDNFNLLISKFKWRSSKESCSSHDLHWFDDSLGYLQILATALLYGSDTLFESIAESIYKDTDILDLESDIPKQPDQILIYCSHSVSPTMHQALANILGQDEYQQLVKTHLERKPLPNKSFIYESINHNRSENLSSFYNSLSDDLKTLFQSQLLIPAEDKCNVLLYILYDTDERKQRFNSKEILSKLLQIQPNLFNLLHTDLETFSDYFDESELQTCILDHCPKKYTDLAHKAFELREEKLIKTGNFQSIRSKESLDYLTQKNPSTLQRVSDFWIKEGFITCLVRLDTECIKTLSNKNQEFMQMFFVKNEGTLKYEDAKQLFHNFEKLKQLLYYQPIFFGNKIDAILPNPNQDQLDDAFQFYVEFLYLSSPNYKKDLLGLEPIAKKLFETNKQGRNILFSIVGLFYAEQMFDTLIENRREETLILLQLNDNNKQNCLAECREESLFSYLKDKYPQEFEVLIRNPHGKESVIATFLKELNDTTREIKEQPLILIQTILNLSPDLKAKEFIVEKRESGESILSILASLDTLPIYQDDSGIIRLDFSTIIEFDWKDDANNTLFHLAAQYDNLSFIENHYKELIVHQFTQNNNGLTPLALAYEKKCPKVFQFLANTLNLSDNDLFKEVCCPISQEIMIDPFLAITGHNNVHSFEKAEIERHLRGENKKCPITNNTIINTGANTTLRNQILTTIKHFQEMQKTSLKLKKLEEQNKLLLHNSQPQ